MGADGDEVSGDCAHVAIVDPHRVARPERDAVRDERPSLAERAPLIEPSRVELRVVDHHFEHVERASITKRAERFDVRVSQTDSDRGCRHDASWAREHTSRVATSADAGEQVCKNAGDAEGAKSMETTVEQDPTRWLPAKVHAAIDSAKGALERTLGDKLTAVVLVGAALNPARGDRAQSPELLAVVRGDYLSRMAALAEALSAPMRAGVRVRLLTSEELERAADVFALEFSEWKSRHRLLSGRDPFEHTVVKPQDLRHSIELELRGLSRRIRNRVLAGIAAGPSRDDPSQAIRDGVDRLMVAAHHVLVLVDGKAVNDETAMLEAIEKRCSVDTAALRGLLSAIRKAKAPPAPLDALTALITSADGLAQWVDRWEARA